MKQTERPPLGIVHEIDEDMRRALVSIAAQLGLKLSDVLAEYAYVRATKRRP